MGEKSWLGYSNLRLQRNISYGFKLLQNLSEWELSLQEVALISLYGDPKPFCDTCHGSWEIQISEGVTVTAFQCNNLKVCKDICTNVSNEVRITSVTGEPREKTRNAPYRKPAMSAQRVL